MSKTVRLPMVKRRIRLVYLLAFIGMILVSVGAFAAAVTITTSNNAAYQGVYILDNGYYQASGTSYTVVEAAQTASASGLAWTSGGTAYVNALVAGDWALSFTLTIEAGGLTSHPYTITVASTSATDVTTTLYTFIFTSPATITAGQTMTIIWDTSAVTWTPPSALTITVA
jgi:hypothetical protein